MARKQKKKRRNKKSAAVTQAANQPAIGKKFLSKGQFSQAIKIFRCLYKETGDEQWSQLLLTAFSGRISQLTAKGMYNEALIIYGNVETLFPNHSPHLHAFLLVNTGKIQEAVQVYRAATETLTKKQQQAIEESFAALLLSGQEGLFEALPKDSALRLHYPHASRALQAYSLKQDVDVLASLQNIPFRSPYKNFRLALKGMVVFHTQPDEAASFFEKIDRNSPFFHMTAPYRHLLPGESEHTEKLSPLDRKVIQSLEGLDKNTLRFLDSLKTHWKTPAYLYQHLVTSGKCLGSKRLRQLCYRLLPHAEEKISDFSRRFGGINDRFEAYRLQALAMEIEDRYYGIAEAWEDACNELILKNNSEDHLKIALLYRHVAEVMEKNPGEYNLNEVQGKLHKSLEYDPGDKETCLQIYHLLRSNTAEQYRHLNLMLEQFSGDTDILLLGVESAARRGAFKKASRLAAEILEIDPINTKVRRLLIDAHLGHAHKLAGLRKYELACRECEAAASFDRADLGRGKIEICQGLLVLLSGEADRGMEFLAAGESKAESPALAHFRICMEAQLLDLPKKWIKSFGVQLKTTLRSAPDETVLLQFIDEIADCEGEKDEVLQSVRAVLTPWLKKGASLDWSRDNMQNLCRLFHGKQYYDLLLAYANGAMKRQPKDPLLQFYCICAKTAGGKKRLNRKQYELLDKAWNSARLQGDKAAAELIDNFLMQHSPFRGAMNDSAFQQFVNIMGAKFEDHLAEGTEPTDEEIDMFFSEIVAEGSLPDELNPSARPQKQQTPKTGNEPQKKAADDTNNPIQLNLFP